MIIAKDIQSLVYPVSAVVIAILSSKSDAKPRSELLYAGQSQHRRGISFNKIDTFHCSKRLSIAGAFRIDSPYCGAWSLALAFFMNFSLINLVGMTQCRMHAGATAKTNFDLSKSRLAGGKHAEKTLTPQRVS